MLDIMLSGDKVVQAIQCNFHIYSLYKKIVVFFFFAFVFRIHNVLHVDNREWESVFCSVEGNLARGGLRLLLVGLALASKPKLKLSFLLS